MQQLVVKKTEAESNLILNGRAALCAGREDMSSEDEADANDHSHRFKKPDNVKDFLERGAIPDAAMIHEARKKRQKARELGRPKKSIGIDLFASMKKMLILLHCSFLGDYVAIEEKKPADNKKGRLIREEAEDDGSEDERVDMSDIKGTKELEERRERFYSAQRHGMLTTLFLDTVC